MVQAAIPVVDGGEDSREELPARTEAAMEGPRPSREKGVAMGRPRQPVSKLQVSVSRATGQPRQEAKVLFRAVANGRMTREEVTMLCTVTPRDAEVAQRLGLGHLLATAETFRRRVLAEFERLSGQR